jgi:hypothetical protein
MKGTEVTSTPPPSASVKPTRPAKPAAKVRVDQLLVERGLVESRARAQALILAGLVYAGEAKIAKAGKRCPRMSRSTCAGATTRGFRAAESSWPTRSRISR